MKDQLKENAEKNSKITLEEFFEKIKDKAPEYIKEAYNKRMKQNEETIHKSESK